MFLSHVPIDHLTEKLDFYVKRYVTHTDTQTDRVTTEGTFSGFQDFFLQSNIKDRPNIQQTFNIKQPTVKS